MAGSAVFSYKEAPDGKSVELTWDCTSDAAAGSVSAPTITQPGDTTAYKAGQKFTGTLGTMRLEPGTGTDQPTDGFDAELRDTDNSGIDYLGGLGDNASQTTTKTGTPLDEVSGVTFDLIQRRLVPYAINCGNSKKFTLSVILYKEVGG